MASDKGVELKGGMYAFMSLRIDTTDLSRIDSLLGEKVQQAPGFFKDTPVVLDLTALDGSSDEALREAAATLDTAALLACIRRHRLHPIVASVGDKSSPLASSVALPLIEGGSRRQSGADGAQGDASRGPAQGAGAEPAPRASLAMGSSGGSARQPNAPRADPADGVPPAVATEVEYVVKSPMLIDRPVRSGQQVYARDTDLIVIGQVGPGAEVIADNNIHVYGALRGRALCGVSGNTATRIFCQSLEAELVSVAGNYRMLETIPPELRGKPARIAWDNDRLSIDPL